ncbi:MAG: hypothetical protein Tsb0020_21230 [Haliangiales bacterium]
MAEHTQLNKPPIEEVVCGFVFASQPVDTMDFGVYWESRRREFPSHEVQPAILDGGAVLQMGALPMRSWLVSNDGSRVLQLQHDRFLMNWKKRDGEYPRFRDHNNRHGLRSQAIEEFEQFAAWLTQRTGQSVQPSRYELTKVDVLKKGEHYDNIDQLGELMSVAKVFADIQVTDPQLLHLRLVETHDQATTNLQIVVNQDRVRLETRHLFPANGDMVTAFDTANRRVNDVFFGLLKDLKPFGE